MERGTVIGLITTRKVLLGAGGYLVKRKRWVFFQFEGFEIFWYLTILLNMLNTLKKREGGLNEKKVVQRHSVETTC